jgi:hypothetical protein
MYNSVCNIVCYFAANRWGRCNIIQMTKMCNFFFFFIYETATLICYLGTEKTDWGMHGYPHNCPGMLSEKSPNITVSMKQLVSLSMRLLEKNYNISVHGDSFFSRRRRTGRLSGLPGSDAHDLLRRRQLDPGQ